MSGASIEHLQNYGMAMGVAGFRMPRSSKLLQMWPAWGLVEPVGTVAVSCLLLYTYASLSVHVEQPAFFTGASRLSPAICADVIAASIVHTTALSRCRGFINPVVLVSVLLTTRR